MLNDKRLIQIGARVELARRSFFDYCRLKAPDFYKPDRKYLVDLCDDFQGFLESEDKVMIINLPPRHGKSRTACCFAEWYLGRDPSRKIMIGSYNETLSTMFSKNVRNTIQEIKADPYKPVFADVFPNVRIKLGDAAMNLWSLDGGYNNYLATSPTGTATGFGCTLMIIDDLIKNAEEANNENTKQKHWEYRQRGSGPSGEGTPHPGYHRRRCADDWFPGYGDGYGEGFLQHVQGRQQH